MLRTLSAAVLACGLGIGILGCQDENTNPNNSSYPSSGTNSTYDSNSGTYNNGNTNWNNNNTTPSGNAHGGMNSGSGYDRGSNSREQSGGLINNSGSMSKEQPSTQPQ